MTDPTSDGARIHGIEALLKMQQDEGPAPVEAWSPPYCGDIGMAIQADGVWLYQGSPIGRLALVKLFARVLRRDADGRTYLVTPAEKVDVTVADAPFLAVEMQTKAWASINISCCGPTSMISFDAGPTIRCASSRRGPTAD